MQCQRTERMALLDQFTRVAIMQCSSDKENDIINHISISVIKRENCETGTNYSSKPEYEHGAMSKMYIVPVSCSR